MRERVQENVPKREREQARECVREWVCITERERVRERERRKNLRQKIFSEGEANKQVDKRILPGSHFSEPFMKRLIREKNFGEKIFEIFFTKAQTTTLGSCQEFKLIVLEAKNKCKIEYFGIKICLLSIEL